jgi:hypothetical protein
MVEFSTVFGFDAASIFAHGADGKSLLLHHTDQLDLPCLLRKIPSWSHIFAASEVSR